MGYPRYIGKGAAVSSITTATPVGGTDVEVNDIEIALVESCGGEPSSWSAAQGFAHAPDSPQATGAGTAGTSHAVYWRRISSVPPTGATLADAGDHTISQILNYRGCIQSGSPFDDSEGLTKPAASTSLVLPGITTTGTERTVLLTASHDLDSGLPQFSSVAMASLTAITERTNGGGSGGNGGGWMLYDGRLAAAGATGAGSAVVGLSINAMLTLALKGPDTSGPRVVSVLPTLSLTSAGSALSWPTPHAVNDVLVLFLESPGDDPITLSTPAGMAAVGDTPQFTGISLAGTRLTAFWCRATSTTMPNFTTAANTNHQIGTMVLIRGCATTGDPWDVVDGTVQAIATSTVSMPSVTTTVANCFVMGVATRDNDLGGAHFSAFANTGLSNLSELFDDGGTNGNGGGLCIVTGDKATAGATGAITATNSASSTSALLTIAFRPEPTGVAITVDNARATSVTSSPLLTENTDLTIDNARAESVTSSPTLAQNSPLTVDGARSATRASTPLLAVLGVLVIDSVRALTRASVALLTQVTDLLVDGTRSTATTSTPLLTQTAPPFLVDNVRARTRAWVVVLGEPDRPADEHIYTVPAESRVLIVQPEPRTYIVPPESRTFTA